MERYYIDTCIWRDYYEGRADRLRPLGEWALAFFNMVIEEKHIIVYSEFVVEELRGRYNQSQIKDIFRLIETEGLLQKAEISVAEVKEAVRISKERKLVFGDTLHAVVAKKEGCILVTRDYHFIELWDIVEIKKPEELI